MPFQYSIESRDERATDARRCARRQLPDDARHRASCRSAVPCPGRRRSCLAVRCWPRGRPRGRSGSAARLALLRASAVAWRRAARLAPRASPPRRPIAAMCSRLRLTVTPPLRPPRAPRSSRTRGRCPSDAPRARPCSRSRAACERSIEAKPRLLRRGERRRSRTSSPRPALSPLVLRAARPPSLEISRCRSRSAPKLRSSLFGLIAIPAPPESGGPLWPVPRSPDITGTAPSPLLPARAIRQTGVQTADPCVCGRETFVRRIFVIATQSDHALRRAQCCGQVAGRDEVYSPPCRSPFACSELPRHAPL